MITAIGHVLPLAVALALSSVPITVTVLILQSENRRRAAVPFLIGWVLSVAVVFMLISWGLVSLPVQLRDRPERLAGIALIVIGAALIVLAVITWLRTRRSTDESVLPTWLSAVGSLSGLTAFGLAIILNLRPKALLMATAAALSIQGDPLSSGEATVVIIVYTAIAACTVVAPIVATLVAPAAMSPRLEATRLWISNNNKTVSTVILLFIGIFVVSTGLGRL